MLNYAEYALKLKAKVHYSFTMLAMRRAQLPQGQTYTDSENVFNY